LIRVVNSTLDLRTVFRHCARGLRALYHCDRVSLGFTGALSFAVSYPTGGPGREVGEPPLSEALAEWMLARRSSRQARLDTDRTFAEDQRLLEQGFRAVVQQPLLCRDRLVGVLGLACRDPERTRGWDLDLLAELGTLLATTVDNAATYAQLAELRARL